MIHYFLQCSNYSDERLTLLNKSISFDCQILEQSDSIIIQLLLFGDCFLNDGDNTPLLTAVIDFVLAAKGFHDSLI